jgi:hypothetical protein
MDRKDSRHTSRRTRSDGHCLVTIDEHVKRSQAHLVLLGAARYAAEAIGQQIRFYRYDDLANAQGPVKPIARVTCKASVLSFAAATGSKAVAVAALADRSLVQLEIIDDASGSAKPHVRTLAADLGGTPRSVVCTRRSVLVVIDSGGYPHLVSVDLTGSGSSRRARLPFANITSLTALDANRSDTLAIIDARHGAHLVGFATASDDEALQVTPIEHELRATAIAALANQWMGIARKGGEVIQVRMPTAAVAATDKTADLCRRLREVLKRCGCACHNGRPPREKCCERCRDCKECPGDDGRPGTDGRPGDGGHPGHDPTDPNGGGRPGGTDPGGGMVDDEPCERRRRALLDWSVAELRPVGQYLLAIAAGGRRLAVLDRNLNVRFERYLGARGSLIATAPGGQDRVLTMRRDRRELEVFELDRYVRGLRAVDQPPPPRRTIDPALTKPSVFRGRRHPSATPNPHLRICVFTITEPGQSFTDPDQAKMHALLTPNVYDICEAYYWENSFQTLTTEFSVFGIHMGGTRPPLVLPRSFASYFFDEYSPGGIEATMPADWATPPTLDGTESLTLHTEPAVGTGKDYPIPFAALWTSRTHNAYPVQINFAGTESVQLQVVDGGGTTRNLTVNFGALNLSHAQGDDEVAFLAALGAHVTSAIRAAETAAGAPIVVQDVKFRRIRSNTNDTQFGRLQGQLRVAAGGAQKGRITLTPPGVVPAALTAIGFGGAGAISGRLTSSGQVGTYFAECLHGARNDAGEGLGLNDPQLDTSVDREEDATALTVRVRIKLATEKGGAGAQITLVSSGGLAGLGWSAAVPVPGSESTANNRNTMRYHQDLANDVFTAAMDHLRAIGPWDPDAVRAQFADFDAMMIGFVGACPTSVPVADRWNCANAVDFTRLRMFVRGHQATDLHSPDPDSPVTMGTDLLIGQRFNQFDPGVMSHEIGHGLTLPDLYSATGFRDDVQYIDAWCQMAGGNSNFNHFCAWSKWAVGWIVENPGDEALNRVIDVAMPAPSGQTVTEGWLCPVEYWDSNMRADIIAAVGSALPVGQMMKVALGSDGGVVDLIELRTRGTTFSQHLPAGASVVVTNVLQPGTDRRWAVNGLYRRQVHLLNGGKILSAVGDRFDFAASPEFPVKGTTVELMELQSVRGAIPIARVRVVREQAEFIDLHFQDNVPSWRSPDIWVDWPGDNADPNAERVYPEGTPTDQGETVRFPSSGAERHFLVVRPHNMGNVRAEDVKVRWFICDPPGAGDDGRWVQRDTQTLPLLDAGTWDTVPFVWNVDAATNDHQCIRAEIIDWTIPAGVDPATGDTVALGSDDVRLQNNNAQKNVFDFEAAT